MPLKLLLLMLLVVMVKWWVILVQHTLRHEITGSGQNFILMNLKCMLCKRTQMKLGEDGELFFSDEFW